MGADTLQNARAGATINCTRFVIASTTEPNTALQASAATVNTIGISANFSRANPDPDQTDAVALIAALVNENVAIYAQGSVGVDLYCNDTWAPGALIMSDASGFGITATAGNWYGARAQTAGVVGALCPVDVFIGQLNA